MATAALSDSEIGELFSVPNTDLRSAIIAELQSILRIHNVPAEDLSFKWESYCLKMGSEDTHLDLKTVQDFKKDLHENLERESRSKASKAGERRTGATPRAGLGGDVFDMYGAGAATCSHRLRSHRLVPNTPTSIATRPHVGSSLKRKSAFETPGSKASRIHPGSSPLGGITPGGKSTP
jgi:DNA polymerase alpha subunit B